MDAAKRRAFRAALEERLGVKISSAWRNASVFVVPIALIAGDASASPWGREKGGVFVSSRTDYYRARGRFLPPDSGGEDALFERFEAFSYAEYGLTDRWMIGGKLVLGRNRAQNLSQSNGVDGLSELEGFAQRRLWRRPQDAASIQVRGGVLRRFATGDEGTARAAEFADDGGDLEIRFLYGRDWRAAPFGVFTTSEFAYRRRFGLAADQLRVDLMVGVKPVSRVLFLVQSANIISLRNNGSAGQDFDVSRATVAAVVRLSKRWSVRAGVSQEVASRRLATGRAYSLGFWTEF